MFASLFFTCFASFSKMCMEGFLMAACDPLMVRCLPMKRNNLSSFYRAKKNNNSSDASPSIVGDVADESPLTKALVAALRHLLLFLILLLSNQGIGHGRRNPLE